MKKILSKLSGRLSLLLFPFALVASFLVPAKALGVMELSNGSGSVGGTEGDPLDTNDYGSGGAGGGTEVQNLYSPTSTLGSLVFSPDRFQILLVPEFVGGTLIFKIIVIDKIALGMGDLSLEGRHVP